MNKIFPLIFLNFFTVNLIFSQVSSLGFVIISATDVNVREEPKTSAQVVTRLQFGQIFKIEEKTEKAELLTNSSADDIPAYWYKISFKGQSGWVYGAFAFELIKATEMKSPWAYGEDQNAPEWYSYNRAERFSLYNAVTGDSGPRAFRNSFFVLIDGIEVDVNSNAILLEGDATTEQFENKRYRNMISVSGSHFEHLVAGFNEAEKIIIFLKSDDLCKICETMTILEGTYQPAKKSYLFTLKYGTQLYTSKRS